MRSFTLEPILDTNPILVVDGDGTVLDCNLAWTKLVAMRRKTGMRASLYDVVSFVGAGSPPTAVTEKDIQVHHVVLREPDAGTPAGEPISTGLLVPVVHRRRDTFMVVLLSPRLFHPDAIRFAELLAMDAATARSAAADAERVAVSEELALPIEVEGSLRSAAAFVAATAGPGAGRVDDLPGELAVRLAEGVPNRRVVVGLRDTAPLRVPSGVFVALPGSTSAVRRTPLGWPAPARPADGEVRLALRECTVAELPAWLQREFADVPLEGAARRFLVCDVPSPAGAGVVAAGPWRDTEAIAPDERLLVEIAGAVLGHRLEAAEREAGLAEQVRRLTHALQAERAALGRSAEQLEPVALSSAMAAALERGRTLEALGRPYAVCGPAGGGRRTVARYLAAIGPRRGAPFVEVGCRFQDEAWLRERLFGTPGVAPGGALDQAAGGTLLLADLESLPPALQAQLLHEWQRPRTTGGAPPPVPVATAESPPERLAQQGRLHPDLAALFGSRTVAVPPLSERSEDLIPLAVRFVQSAAAEAGRPVPRLAPRAVDRLRALPWPGQVRELKAALEGAVALASGELIDADQLPAAEAPETLSGSVPAPPPAIDLSQSFAELKQQWVDHFERAYLDAALRRSAGNLSAAARLAHLDKKNFHAKAVRHGLAGSANGRGGQLKARGGRRRMPAESGEQPKGGKP